VSVAIQKPARENLYGQAKDVASGAAEGVRKTASSFEDNRSPYDRRQPLHGRCDCTCVGLAFRADPSPVLAE
jgi:hypothetical protein